MVGIGHDFLCEDVDAFDSFGSKSFSNNSSLYCINVETHISNIKQINGCLRVWNTLVCKHVCSDHFKFCHISEFHASSTAYIAPTLFDQRTRLLSTTYIPNIRQPIILYIPPISKDLYRIITDPISHHHLCFNNNNILTIQRRRSSMFYQIIHNQSQKY